MDKIIAESHKRLQTKGFEEELQGHVAAASLLDSRVLAKLSLPGSQRTDSNNVQM